MKFYQSLLAIATLAIFTAGGMDRIIYGAGAPPPSIGFFVTKGFPVADTFKASPILDVSSLISHFF